VIFTNGIQRGLQVNDFIDQLDGHVLRAMIDQATVSFWVLDENERICFVNPAGASLTGYALDELLGQPFSILLDGERAARHEEWIKAYSRRGGPSSILGQVREFQLRHRSGEMIDIELKAFPLNASDRGSMLYGGLISDNRDRKTMESGLRAQATHDPLTGCLNRDGFFPAAQRALREARAHRHSLALLLLDLDRFKRVNDRYGHQAGDAVLQQVVAELARTLREDDLLGRYGGEEFVVLLSDMDPEKVVEIAERLRSHVEALELRHDGRRLSITISIGCAMLRQDDDIDTLVARADQRLYQAKQTGRNRVVHRDEPARS